eukprot:CAMPEP_0170763634 /NCGR_PEP_ID=MMETSP0733-20121128/3510_1 /TAXON_ID=186038 /ORGANISM="Fragilariopsis kerguelensis, Strain L26-C5" /LENGTH=290 /DNA_ID=CAMNT_0011104099 /DNA_START=52 /DNA_END=921 /DNA_ORIENTATION=-
MEFLGVGLPERKQEPQDIDGKDTNGVVIGINGTGPEEKIDSFLSSLSKITDRRDKHPCWENATYFKTTNTGIANEDLLLKAGKIDYEKAKENATDLWKHQTLPIDDANVPYDGIREKKERHMRRALALFIYECLGTTSGLKTDIENHLAGDNIQYDGPMVWLTLVDILFPILSGPPKLDRKESFRTKLESYLTNLKIQKHDYDKYNIIIENGLQLQPELIESIFNGDPSNILDNASQPLFKKLIVRNMVFEKEKEKDDKKLMKYPPDCYSFLSFHGEKHDGAIILGLVAW